MCEKGSLVQTKQTKCFITFGWYVDKNAVKYRLSKALLNAVKPVFTGGVSLCSSLEIILATSLSKCGFDLIHL